MSGFISRLKNGDDDAWNKYWQAINRRFGSFFHSCCDVEDIGMEALRKACSSNWRGLSDSVATYLVLSRLLNKGHDSMVEMLRKRGSSSITLGDSDTNREGKPNIPSDRIEVIDNYDRVISRLQKMIGQPWVMPVIEGMRDGSSLEEIALRLGISTKTVGRYINRIVSVGKEIHEE
jgi:hypothetical protein